MAAKDSTLGDMVNVVGVKWFKEIVNERVKQLQTEFQQLKGQMPMFGPLANLGDQIAPDLEQLKAEVGYLKNISEAKIYSENHSFNANDILFPNNNFSIENMSQLFQEGESISKMLIKIQMGETFAILNRLLDKLKVLDQKIGFDEKIKKVNREDVLYLMNKEVDGWSKEIIGFVAPNETDRDNVMGELQTINNTQDWNDKLKNAYLIDRYFSRFKINSLFGNLMQPSDLESPEKQKELLIYSKVMATLHQLLYWLKLGIVLDNGQKGIN